MSNIPFKQRTLNTIISCASDYKAVFLDYEYLIYSNKFTIQAYYTISAKDGNYKHLTGVNSNLSPYEFYEKSINNTLLETDFDFYKPNETEKFVKGVVRSKVIALPFMATFFSKKLMAQESFNQGKTTCSLATTDNMITIGFEDRINARPKTLLKGNEIDMNNSVDISLVLRRNISSEIFDTIVQGDIRDFCVLFPNMFDCNIKQCKMNHIR